MCLRRKRLRLASAMETRAGTGKSLIAEQEPMQFILIRFFGASDGIDQSTKVLP
jgi:hypothetical protein